MIIARNHMLIGFLYIVLVTVALAGCSLSGGAAAPNPNPGSISPASLQASDGIAFAIHLDWENDTAESFNQRLGQGKPAAAYGIFVRFPLPYNTDWIRLDKFLGEMDRLGAAGLIVLQPAQGLSTVTSQTAGKSPAASRTIRGRCSSTSGMK